MKSGTPPSGLSREVELIMAGAAILVTSPLTLIVALAIKIGGGVGPILFRQKRMGLDGQEFTLLKFRTMTSGNTGPLITSANDRRVTGLGKILRKTKLDELPELWNIVRGDMSFVGPRPEVPDLVDKYDPVWTEILSGRPGLTDPVTLRLRNEEALLADVVDKETYYREILQPYKMRGYVKFMRERSAWSDIKLIFQTIKAVALASTAPPPSHEEITWTAEDLRPHSN